MSMTDMDVHTDMPPVVHPDTPERSDDKDAILAVAKAMHRVKDPDCKNWDGHPWMHDAEVFVAASRALAGH